MQDVKALKRRVEVSFPDLSAEDLELLFPPKVGHWIGLLGVQEAWSSTCTGCSRLPSTCFKLRTYHSSTITGGSAAHEVEEQGDSLHMQWAIPLVL